MNGANGSNVRVLGELTTAPSDHEERRGKESQKGPGRKGSPSEPAEVEPDDACPFTVAKPDLAPRCQRQTKKECGQDRHCCSRSH